MTNLDNVLLDEFKERELEILSLMAAGYTNVAIGRELFITKETVRWYNKQIYSKLGTSRRTEAIAKAQRLGLIGSPQEEETAAAEQQAQLLLKHSRFLRKLGRFPQAEQQLQQAQSLIQPLNNPLLQLNALAQLTSILLDQIRYQEVTHYAQIYLQLSRQLGNRKHEARALSRLANSYYGLGDFKHSEEFNQQSLQLARQREDDVGVARLTYNLALNHYNEGRLAEAQPLLEESVTLKRLIGDKAGLTSRLTLLSKLRTLEGAYPQAAAYLEEEFTIAQEINEPVRLISVLWAYGLFYELQEAWPDAITYYRQRLDLARETHHQNALMYVPLDLARIYLRLNLTEQARHYLLQAIEPILEKGSTKEYAMALFVFSDYFQATADYAQSGRLYTLYQQTGIHDIELTKDYARLHHTLQIHLPPAKWQALQPPALPTDLKPLLATLFTELNQRT